jgi:hypothetical protein
MQIKRWSCRCDRLQSQCRGAGAWGWGTEGKTGCVAANGLGPVWSEQWAGITWEATTRASAAAPAAGPRGPVLGRAWCLSWRVAL